MKRSKIRPTLTFSLLSILAILALLIPSACAPSQNIALTLTMLPGTFTPLPPTRWPTETPVGGGIRRSTASPRVITPGSGPSMPTSTQLPGTAEACPPFKFDTSVPSVDSPDSFIGKHYDDQAPPVGITWLGSMALPSDRYIYTHVNIQNRDIYWVQQLVCRDTAGVAYYEISDVLTLPNLDTTNHQVLTELCYQGENQVPNAIAYGTYDPSQPASQQPGGKTGWALQIQRAWTVNGRFIPLDTQGLTCVHPQNP